MLLGCLLKQPSLLALSQYPLTKADFSPVKFHETMYVAIKKLARAGVQEISEIEIENVAKTNIAAMEILQDNNYMDFIYMTKELANLENFGYYYDVIRKFSLLRELQDNGYDITEFYDELQDEETRETSFAKLTIQSILNTIDLRNTKLRGKYDVKYVRDEIVVGEDIDNLLEEFEEKPSFGAHLCSPYLTQIIWGFSRGNLIMRSSTSGGGKSRIAVADICGLCVDQYYDFNKKDFVSNPNYQGPGFFIHTELDTRREMQPMFLACISGVPTNTITMGKCTDEEILRVKKAAEIICNNNLVLTDMPDFTSASLERKIKEQVENNGAVFGCFDYMMLNSPLSIEYKQNTGVQAREDMALRGLATDLKEYAEKYQVGLLTMTQTNGAEKTMEFPDESCIAGSKATRNKVDAGFIMLPAKDRQKEIRIVAPFIQAKGAIGNKAIEVTKPNRITYVYKTRFGEYADRKIKIFHRFDASIMRNTDLFCTDAKNEFVKIPYPAYEGTVVSK